MATTIDFHPATRALARLVAGTRDDQLGAPTPCPAYAVGDLLAHLHGLTWAFTQAARKASYDAAAPGPGALPPGWRTEIVAALPELAVAWDDPSAYDGETRAGPVVLPGEVAALVALDEVVVHAWDLAVATGQLYGDEPDLGDAVAACTGFVATFEPPPGGAADDGGLFGPPVAVPDDAPALDRLVAMTGRDPHWLAP